VEGEEAEEAEEEDLREQYSHLSLGLLSRVTFLDESAFEHQEVKSRIDFPNPPVTRFYPDGPLEGRRLRDSQMHGVAWMMTRLEAGGGIIADEIGLGKVAPLSRCH
jgi:hypothetical protein